MPKDARDLAQDFIKMEEVVNVVVLVTRDVIQYTVPSFPVFKATLREVKLQWDDEEKTIHVFDAFARDCNLLLVSRGQTTNSFTGRYRLQSQYKCP